MVNWHCIAWSILVTISVDMWWWGRRAVPVIKLSMAMDDFCNVPPNIKVHGWAGNFFQLFCISHWLFPCCVQYMNDLILGSPLSHFNVGITVDNYYQMSWIYALLKEL